MAFVNFTPNFLKNVAMANDGGSSQKAADVQDVQSRVQTSNIFEDSGASLTATSKNDMRLSEQKGSFAEMVEEFQKKQEEYRALQDKLLEISEERRTLAQNFRNFPLVQGLYGMLDKAVAADDKEKIESALQDINNFKAEQEKHVKGNIASSQIKFQ